MSKTVLKYVQKCLDTMDSDQVDSISDTEESLQVANILEEVYFELIFRDEWEFLDQAATLTAAANLAQPTSFTINEQYNKIHFVRYNVADDGADAQYRTLQQLSPIEFVTKFGVPGEGRTLVDLGSKLSFYVATNRQPTYFTVLTDNTIVCDSYDSDIDSTLSASKINAYANIIPAFEIEDDFEVNLPIHMEPLLQAELNSNAHAYVLKQSSAKDEQKALRQLAQNRRRQSKFHDHSHYRVKYGRR